MDVSGEDVSGTAWSDEFIRSERPWERGTASLPWTAWPSMEAMQFLASMDVRSPIFTERARSERRCYYRLLERTVDSLLERTVDSFLERICVNFTPVVSDGVNFTPSQRRMV